jgi:putative peptidoglycan lipid II flippase
MRMNPAAAIVRWRELVGHSPLRRLGHDALVAVMTSAVGKGLGFLKEVLIAAMFGLSGALDIYLMGVVLIGFPVTVLLNAVQTALIAALAVEREPSNAGRMYATTALTTVIGLAAMLPIWMVLVPNVLPWLASGFSPEKRHELEVALYWLTPYYFFTGLNLLGYGALQARGRYLANGLLPAVTPLTSIVILLMAGAMRDWHVLTTALVVGTALECAALHYTLRRAGQIAKPQWSTVAPVITASLMLLPGTFMVSVGPVIEQAIAASMGEGTNAALGYGLKFPVAIQGMLVTAVGITALPYFASQLAQNRAAYCLHSLTKLTWLLLAGGLVVAIPLAVLSDEIIMLLYQRGAFDSAATERVAPIQLAYFAQLPFAIVAMLGLKALAALSREGLLSVYVSFGVVLQCALAYMLGIHFGPVGIAWAATVVSGVLAIVCFLTARATLHRLVKT